MELKQEIWRVIDFVDEYMCQKAIANFTDRINSYKLYRGGHIADVLFHNLIRTYTKCKNIKYNLFCKRFNELLHF